MKASQWISLKHVFAPGFAHVQIFRQIYPGEHLNISQFITSRKWKQRDDGVIPELSASDAAFSLRDTKREETTSTYADNSLAYSCFHLFPLYFSSGLYILKKNKRISC